VPRFVSFIRTVMGFLARVFISEPRHMSSDQAKAELEMMTRANRDQSH
jgi:hypothetical protein